MKKKTKEKVLKGILSILTGFLLISIAYYERKIERSPMIIANVDENNNKVYQDVQKEDLMSILENETGVFLLVSSRISAGRFIDLLYDFKGDYTIYVYSLKNDEISLSLNNNDIIVNKKQSKLYDELISYLGVYADDYVFVQEDGTVVKTDYKVVYTPTVLFIKNGRPIYSYSNISEEMTDDELKEIYKQGYEALNEFNL